MTHTLRRHLDPLDWEIVERAVQGVWDTIYSGSALVDLESDEELEHALRRELAETVRVSGVSDAEALLDLLNEGLGERIGKLRPRSLATASIAAQVSSSNCARLPDHLAFPSRETQVCKRSIPSIDRSHANRIRADTTETARPERPPI